MGARPVRAGTGGLAQLGDRLAGRRRRGGPARGPAGAGVRRPSFLLRRQLHPARPARRRAHPPRARRPSLYTLQGRGDGLGPGLHAPGARLPLGPAGPAGCSACRRPGRHSPSSGAATTRAWAGDKGALNAIGWCHALLGEHGAALACCEQAIVLHQPARQPTARGGPDLGQPRPDAPPPRPAPPGGRLLRARPRPLPRAGGARPGRSLQRGRHPGAPRRHPAGRGRHRRPLPEPPGSAGSRSSTPSGTPRPPMPAPSWPVSARTPVPDLRPSGAAGPGAGSRRSPGPPPPWMPPPPSGSSRSVWIMTASTSSVVFRAWSRGAMFISLHRARLRPVGEAGGMQGDRPEPTPEPLRAR